MVVSPLISRNESPRTRPRENSRCSCNRKSRLWVEGGVPAKPLCFTTRQPGEHLFLVFSRPSYLSNPIYLRTFFLDTRASAVLAT